MVKADRSRILRTSAKEDAIIAAVERGPWRSPRDIVLELELSQLKVLELLHYDRRQPHRYTWKEYLFPDDRSRTPKYENGYDFRQRRIASFTLHSADKWSVPYATQFDQLIQVTSEHGIIIIISANGVLTPDSGSKLGLVWSGPKPSVPTCYRAADRSTILRFSGKCYTGTASSSSGCESDLVSACRRTSALWGRCPEVPEPDISGRGGTYTASFFDGSDSDKNVHV